MLTCSAAALGKVAYVVYTVTPVADLRRLPGNCHCQVPGWTDVHCQARTGMNTQTCCCRVKLEVVQQHCLASRCHGDGYSARGKICSTKIRPDRITAWSS